MGKKLKLLGLGLLAYNFGSPYLNRNSSTSYPDREGPIQRMEMSSFTSLEEIFSKINFSFHSMEGIKWKGDLLFDITDNYWVDKAAYKITPSETKKVLETTHELHNMCLEATDFAIADDEILTRIFDIPEQMIPLIRESWKQKQPDLLARYDFLVGEGGKLYFLECNGDTPSGIVESGPAQREWASFMNLPQFNVLEQNITKSFDRIAKKHGANTVLMFKNENIEDSSTANCVASLIEKNSGLKIQTENIESITSKFKEAVQNSQKALIWRQYPFEWLASEDTQSIFFDPQFYKATSPAMIEPAWKIIMSSKAMSVLLKAMYPNSPYLLETSLAPFKDGEPQLSKQKFGREGEHIFYSEDSESLESFLEKAYKNYFYPPVFQKFMHSATHQDRHITLSSWMVQGELSGIIVREDINTIIGTGSSVVPYFIDEEIKKQTIDVELKSTDRQKEITDVLYPNRQYDSNLKEIKIKPTSHSTMSKLFMKDYNPSAVKSALISQFNQTHQQRDQIIPQESEGEGFSTEQMLLGFAPIAALGMMHNQNKNKKPEEEKTQRGYTGTSGSGGGNSWYEPNSSKTKAAPRSVQPAGSTGHRFSSHS